jgi:putative flippase GtrA
MWPRDLARRSLSREVLTFLTVGGAGYLVDVGAFNILRSLAPFNTVDPTVARTLAVAVAMCVTYAGNRTLTWRDHTRGNRRREVGLFVLFNIIGFGFSVLTLAVSHDVLRLTSRLADNVSANFVGLALGTVFRYLTYKHFVFTVRPTTSRTRDVSAPANTPMPEPGNADVLVD